MSLQYLTSRFQNCYKAVICAWLMVSAFWMELFAVIMLSQSCHCIFGYVWVKSHISVHRSLYQKDPCPNTMRDYWTRVRDIGVWAGCSDCMGLGLSSLGKKDDTDVGKRMNWISDDSEWTAETVSPVHQIFPLLLITWCDYISSLHEVKSDRVFDVHWLMKWESFTIPSFEITSTVSDVSFRKDYVKPQPAHSGYIVGGRKKPVLKNNLSLRDW